MTLTTHERLIIAALPLVPPSHNGAEPPLKPIRQRCGRGAAMITLKLTFDECATTPGDGPSPARRSTA